MAKLTNSITPTRTAKALGWLPAPFRRIPLKILKQLAPYNSWGNKVVFDIDFLRAHGRFPGIVGLFNDELYPVFTTEEILAPERQFSSDKYLGKIFARGILGEDICVPTLGVIHNISDVDTYEFPADCVIKPTHSSGKLIFRKGNEPVDRKEIRSWFQHNFYRQNRESNYRYLKPRVIIEPKLFEDNPVDDFKVFCVSGEPRIVLFVADRNRKWARLALTPDWEPLPVSLEPGKPDPLPEKPKTLGRMLEYAKRLSEPFRVVRLDFYASDDVLLLGEISHVHMRAMEKFRSPEEERAFSAQLFDDASS